MVLLSGKNCYLYVKLDEPTLIYSLTDEETCTVILSLDLYVLCSHTTLIILF